MNPVVRMPDPHKENQTPLSVNEKEHYEQRIRELNHSIDHYKIELKSIIEQKALQTETLKEIYTSKSWKILSYLHRLCHQKRKMISFFRAAIALYKRAGGLFRLCRNLLTILKQEGFLGLKKKFIFFLRRSDVLAAPMVSSDDLYTKEGIDKTTFSPKVSVIVPNYNHAPYLKKRLDSVYLQTYKNFEVILLDDFSRDNSREILSQYADKYRSITTVVFNEVNSGGVFRQWEKGLKLAKGEIVWIAESDDYCDLNFLTELTEFFSNEAVMLAYCRSDFVQEDSLKVTTNIENHLSDLCLDCWYRKKPFIRSAHWLVNNAWGIKNIIPNVSSALFRHPGSLTTLSPEDWIKLKLCGDWIFYLSIVRGGLVGYCPTTTNYYRQHLNSTSLNIQKTSEYYLEHEVVAKTLLSLYKINNDVLEKQSTILYDHWIEAKGRFLFKEFTSLYNLDRARQDAKPRKPNLLMGVYALVAGGGETFPIFLANMMKEKGYGVTLFNYMQEKTEPAARNLIKKTIPLLEFNQPERMEGIFRDLGIEIIHTHHASVDVTIAMSLSRSPDIARIVTMHGMYEMMNDTQIKHLLPLLQKSVDRFVYAAEKNITPFSETFRHEKGFTKIDNALPIQDITPISRDDLGIGSTDFILCMVARGIPEKGWQEAIDSVCWANDHSTRKIHLLMIGEGPEFTRLKALVTPDFIHLLGFKPQIRNYFACSDMGFIPSRFEGESFPLVLIDCLHTGKPVLASNIGEIRHMLSTKQGLAGELIELDNWKISVTALGKQIVNLANDPDRYNQIMRNVAIAALKFDPATMLEKYETVYQSCLSLKSNETAHAL